MINCHQRLSRARRSKVLRLARALKSRAGRLSFAIPRSVLQDERTEHRNSHSSRAFNVQKIGEEGDLARRKLKAKMEFAERKFRQEQLLHDYRRRVEFGEPLAGLSRSSALCRRASRAHEAVEIAGSNISSVVSGYSKSGSLGKPRPIFVATHRSYLRDVPVDL